MRALQDAAKTEEFTLEPVSGFRSVERQAQLIRGKLARGQRLDDILRSNAAPGYSEHHTGRALDITDGRLAAAQRIVRTNRGVCLAVASCKALWVPPQLFA